MTPEERRAIERTLRPATPIEIGPPPTLKKIVEARQRHAADYQEELRTEAHQPIRRPLSSAHEAP